jgi:hypothetical protein
MKKALKRVLERLRASTNGRFRNRSSVRGGLQEPQQMHVHAARFSVRA